jgi:hypothetical protein
MLVTNLNFGLQQTQVLAQPQQSSVILSAAPGPLTAQVIAPALVATILPESILTAIDNPNFERAGENYINSEPEILFVCEHIVNDKLNGVLLVFEQLGTSTHYEVFKKNLFHADSDFERILFLDVVSLREETQKHLDYLKNTLGISIDPAKTLVILDTVVKEDRVYEYKIAAGRVPTNFTEVEYDLIMRSKDKLTPATIDPSTTLSVFDLSGVILGSRDLAWVLSLLNQKLFFFGADSKKQVGALLGGAQELYIPKNTQDVLAIFNEAISLFDLRSSVRKLLVELRGISLQHLDISLDAIDKTTQTFSYDVFKELITKATPSLNVLLETAQAATDQKKLVEALSKLAITIPKNSGTEAFSSIKSISNILKFIRDTIELSVFSQDEKNIKALQEQLAVVTAPAAQTTNSSTASTSTMVSNTAGTSSTTQSSTTQATTSAATTSGAKPGVKIV